MLWGLTSEDPELNLHPVQEKAVDDKLEKWIESDEDVLDRLRDAVDAYTYLCYRKLTDTEQGRLKTTGGIPRLLSLLDAKPDGIKLGEKLLITWALSRRQGDLKPRLSSKPYGRVNFESGPVGKNWVRTDRMFVTVVDKDTDAGEIPGLLLDALSAWDPAPHRLLMSKMRAVLDERGVPVEAEVLSDLYLQAAWLEEFLEPDEAERSRNVRGSVRRHWESIGYVLEQDVADYADRLSRDIMHLDRESVIDRFTRSGVAARRSDILKHLNCHVCSKRVEGSHLSIGHIIRVGDAADNDFRVCLTPACDLEPGQKVGSGFHKNLGDWMPFTAVRLLPTCVPEALNRVTAARHIFFKQESESGIRVFECAESLSEPMFVANQGRFLRDGAFDLELTRIRASGAEIHTKPVSGLVVGQLRYEYALNLLHRLGHHLSRVGLDFKPPEEASDAVG